jgi:hypothetical protein
MEAKRTQCTNTAISGKINRMLINEIWKNLRTFGKKGCQKFPFVKTRTRDTLSKYDSHIRTTPWLPHIQGSEGNQFKLSIFIVI